MKPITLVPRPFRDFVAEPSKDKWISWGIQKLNSFGARKAAIENVEKFFDWAKMPGLKPLAVYTGNVYDTACDAAENFGRRANLIQTAARTGLAVGVALTVLAVGGSATATAVILVPTAIASLPAAAMAGGFLLGWQGVAVLVSTVSAPVLAEILTGAGMMAGAYLLLEYHDLHTKIPVICWIPTGLLEIPLYPVSLLGAAFFQAYQAYNSLPVQADVN